MNRNLEKARALLDQYAQMKESDPAGHRVIAQAVAEMHKSLVVIADYVMSVNKPILATPADRALAYIRHGAQPPPIDPAETQLGPIAAEFLDTLMNELNNNGEWKFNERYVMGTRRIGDRLEVDLSGSPAFPQPMMLSFLLEKPRLNPWTSRAEKYELLSQLCKDLGMVVMSQHGQQMVPETGRWAVVAFAHADDEECEYTRRFDSLVKAYADGLHQLKHFGGKVVLLDDERDTFQFEAQEAEDWRAGFQKLGATCRHQTFKECDESCAGWFVNADTLEVERCDTCKRFDSDEEAAEHVSNCVAALEQKPLYKTRWQVTASPDEQGENIIRSFRRIEDADAFGRKVLKEGGKALQLKDLKLKQEWAWATDENEWLDRIEDVKSVSWNDDAIQFPRLLAELMANGELTSDGESEFFSLKVSDICESMDLTWEDVTEIFNRAQDAWEDMK